MLPALLLYGKSNIRKQSAYSTQQIYNVVPTCKRCTMYIVQYENSSRGRFNLPKNANSPASLDDFRSMSGVSVQYKKTVNYKNILQSSPISKQGFHCHLFVPADSWGGVGEGWEKYWKCREQNNREKVGSVAVQKNNFEAYWLESFTSKYTNYTVHRWCTVHCIRIPTQCPKSKFH